MSLGRNMKTSYLDLKILSNSFHDIPLTVAHISIRKTATYKNKLLESLAIVNK